MGRGGSPSREQSSHRRLGVGNAGRRRGVWQCGRGWPWAGEGAVRGQQDGGRFIEKDGWGRKKEPRKDKAMWKFL